MYRVYWHSQTHRQLATFLCKRPWITLESQSGGGGGADDRICVVNYAADGSGGGGHAYEHVCTQGGR